jgi:hypothetical protein
MNLRPVVVESSIDMDGCYFNENYALIRKKLGYSPVNYQQIPDYNEQLLNDITTELRVANASKSILNLNSNRQCYHSDKHNYLREDYIIGSAFPAILALHARLQASVTVINPSLVCEVNKLLLADIYNDLEIGTCFDLAVTEYEKQQTNINHTELQQHPEWVFDSTKLTIIYAQIQRAAKQNPDADIIFNFYDDREDILLSLYEFFAVRPYLIPANLTLKMKFYKGNEVILKNSIQGTGLIDASYNVTIKVIAETCGVVSKSFGSCPISALYELRPDDMHLFPQYRNMNDFDKLKYELNSIKLNLLHKDCEFNETDKYAVQEIIKDIKSIMVDTKPKEVTQLLGRACVINKLCFNRNHTDSLNKLEQYVEQDTCSKSWPTLTKNIALLCASLVLVAACVTLAVFSFGGSSVLSAIGISKGLILAFKCISIIGGLLSIAYTAKKGRELTDTKLGKVSALGMFHGSVTTPKANVPSQTIPEHDDAIISFKREVANSFANDEMEEEDSQLQPSTPSI